MGCAILRAVRDFECMPLAVMPQAWDHPDWLWEIFLLI
jgi:hypothetical protein